MATRVKRRSLVWLLSVPLMLGGTEAAHQLAFRLAYPGGWERAQALQESGHGYFSWLPVVGGIGAALAFSALVVHGRHAATGGRPTDAPRLSRFAALPLLAFAVQEHLEQLVHTGTITGVAAQPTFMLGLLLQLPFAAAAYLLARSLLRAARRVGVALTRTKARRRRPLLPVRFRLAPGLEVLPLRAAALAGGHAERGPPL